MRGNVAELLVPAITGSLETVVIGVAGLALHSSVNPFAWCVELKDGHVEC